MAIPANVLAALTGAYGGTIHPTVLSALNQAFGGAPAAAAPAAAPAPVAAAVAPHGGPGGMLHGGGLGALLALLAANSHLGNVHQQGMNAPPGSQTGAGRGRETLGDPEFQAMMARAGTPVAPQWLSAYNPTSPGSGSPDSGHPTNPVPGLPSPINSAAYAAGAAAAAAAAAQSGGAPHPGWPVIGGPAAPVHPPAPYNPALGSFGGGLGAATVGAQRPTYRGHGAGLVY